MKWNVKGAWKADGEEGRMEVVAESKPQAERLAALRGMLVESAWPSDREPEGALLADGEPRHQKRFTAESSHHVLYVSAYALVAVGFLGLIVGASLVFFAVTSSIGESRPFAFTGLMVAGNGLLLMFVGSTGEAIREIALNTRK